MRRFLCALGLLLGVPAASAELPEPAGFRTIFKTSSTIRGVDNDDPKELRLFGWTNLALFSIGRPSATEIQALSAVIEAAEKSNRSVELVYDAANGRIDEKEGYIVYPLCAIALDEKRFNSRHPCTESSKQADDKDMRRRLAIAVAEALEGEPRRARAVLDALVATNRLSRGSLIIALRARVEALDNIGSGVGTSSSESDEAFFAALSDSRAIQKLVPDDEKAAIDGARLLADLGDYEAATIAYQTAIRRWPARAAQLGVSLGVVARQNGELEKSLQHFNDVAATHGANLGMRYQYHRGWTLLAMSRFEEAAASFTEGMRNQADYSWAFIRRGCAYAGAGRLDLASDDLAQGIMLSDRFAPSPPTAISIDQRAKLLAIRNALTTVRQTTPGAAIPALCNNLSAIGDEPRPRSKLLDQAGSN